MVSTRLLVCGTLLVSFLAGGIPGSVAAAEEDAVDREQFDTSVAKGIAFLRTVQAEDGSFSSFSGIGVTTLVTTALLRHGLSVDDPLVARSLEYLEGFVQPEGGIHVPDTHYRNYETSMAMLAFSAANDDGRYDAILSRANQFIQGIQWGLGQGVGPDEAAYGGAGYGHSSRPDLSNTHFFIEALRASGSGEKDPAIERALLFISRCQNFESEHNQLPFAARNPDGGMYYTPAAGGSSPAGETANGGLRSYGAMTYAGLKSFIHCGLDAEDPRFQAAYDWIKNNYTLETNPGMGDAGLYYYYHTFAKALAAMEVDTVIDAEGVEHHWQAELVAELASRQREEGSWANENERWLEGDPALATGFSLLALSYCREAEEGDE